MKTWDFVQKVVAPDRVANSSFGKSVSVNGNRLIVGAPRQSLDDNYDNYIENAGAAYLFERDALDTWNFVAKKTPTDRDYNDRFGNSVAIESNSALVGASWEDEDESGVNFIDGAGSCYISQFGFPLVQTNKLNLSSEILLYPNPSTGIVNIQSQTTLGPTSIYNCYGQEVFHEQQIIKSNTINVSNLPKGVYMIYIGASQGQKLIIN